MWKKVISLFLVLFILLTLIGCGDITTPDGDESGQYNDSTQDLILIKNINPENNVVGTVTENAFAKNKEIGADIIAVLGEKDSFGNTENLTGAIYISEEDALEVIANNKGLATSLKDSQGNVIVFENYTNYTVDMSIFDSNGNLILDPTMLELDPYELEEVQKYYLSDEEVDKFKWAARIIGYTACAVSIVSDIITWGGTTAAVVKACGSVLISEVLNATTTDADNMLYNSAKLIGCGSAFSSLYQLTGCVGSIIAVIAEVSENPNQPPTIISLSAESVYIKPTETVEIICYVDDLDDTENFTFWWSSPDGGDFIAMPYFYQPNLPSWESNVPWKCSSTIIWTAPDSPGTYVITCTVIDKEGETDSKSVSISVEGTNHAPVISSLTANPSSVDINQTTAITCTASDEDVGDTLTYTWTKNVGSFEGDTSGPSVTWRAPSTADIYTVVGCEVSDGEGGEDSESINIIVTEPDDNHAPVSGTWIMEISITSSGGEPECICGSLCNNSLLGHSGSYTFDVQQLGSSFYSDSWLPTTISGTINGTSIIFSVILPDDEEANLCGDYVDFIGQISDNTIIGNFSGRDCIYNCVWAGDFYVDIIYQ